MTYMTTSIMKNHGQWKPNNKSNNHLKLNNNKWTYQKIPEETPEVESTEPKPENSYKPGLTEQLGFLKGSEEGFFIDLYDSVLKIIR